MGLQASLLSLQPNLQCPLSSRWSSTSLTQQPYSLSAIANMFCEIEDYGEVKLFPQEMWPAKRQEYLASSPNRNLHLPLALPSRTPDDWFERCIERVRKTTFLRGSAERRPFIHPRISDTSSSRSPSTLRSSSALPPPTTPSVRSTPRASTVDYSSLRVKRTCPSGLRIRLPCVLVQATLTRKGAKPRGNGAFGCSIPKEVESSRDFVLPPWVQPSDESASTSQEMQAIGSVVGPSTLPESGASPSFNDSEESPGGDFDDMSMMHQEPEACPSSPLPRFSASSVPPVAAEGERNVLRTGRQSSELEDDAEDEEDEEVDQLEPSDEETAGPTTPGPAAGSPSPSPRPPRVQEIEVTSDVQHHNLAPLKLHLAYPPPDDLESLEDTKDEDIISLGSPDRHKSLFSDLPSEESRFFVARSLTFRSEADNRPTIGNDGERTPISPTGSFSQWVHSTPRGTPVPPDIHRRSSSPSSDNVNSRIPTIFNSEGVCLEQLAVEQELTRSLSPLSRRMSVMSDTPSLTRSSMTPPVMSQQGRKHPSALMTFLEGLEEPMLHLLEVMEKLGFTTDARLNSLARNRDTWDQIAAQIQTKDTLSDWILVKEGLEIRARNLGIASASQ